MVAAAGLTRRELAPIVLFLFGGLILFAFSHFNGSLRCEPSSESLPYDLVTFSSICNNQTIQPELVRQTIFDGLFDGASPYDGFPVEPIGNLLQDKVKLQGWGSKDPVFERLLKEVKPKVVIEIGTFLGASAIHLARLSERIGLENQIICIDDFRGWPGFREKFSYVKQLNGDVMLLQNFMQNVVKSGFQKRIIPVPFSTAHAMTYFCKLGIKADLIEVDAGHDFHSAWIDINMAYNLLRPGGVMFGHDFKNKADKAGVRRAVLLFAKLHGLQVEPDGAHWILRPANYQIKADS